MKKFTVPALTVLAGCLIAGCGEDRVADRPGNGTDKPAVSTESARTTSETETLRDPVEDAFTVQLPKGWHNKAYSARTYDIHRSVCLSVSPDGDTVLYYGDPGLPNYWTPASANEMTYKFAEAIPMIKIQEYEPAPEYIKGYAQRKFGKLEGFEITGVEDDPETAEAGRQAFLNAGLQSDLTAAKLRFQFKDKGAQMHGMIGLYISHMNGMFIVDVGGISTKGDPNEYEGMLKAIRSSVKMNPEWQAKQNQLHEQRMADIRRQTELMTQRHHQNMAAIQASAARHQQRMQSIWAANDASMANYWQRSAASDLQHQNFINYINDEHTVVNSSGQTFQVDNSYDKYYVNKNNNSYVGGHSTSDLESLRKMGLNPNDYEEVQIRR